MDGTSTQPSAVRVRGLKRSLRPAGLSAILLWLAGLAGCMVGPSYRPPQTRPPDAWHETLTRGLTEGQSNLQTWWAVFNDPILTSLIERASTDNLQLKEAVSRIREARASRGIAAGELFPTVTGNASYERSRVSENGLQAPPKRPTRTGQFADTAAKGMAGTAITGATGVPGPIVNAGLGLIPTPTHSVTPDPMNLSAAGFDSSWEIDVFGGIRRNIQSADAGVQATVEQYRDLLVSLLAEVALNYAEVRTLQSRLEYAEANVVRQKKTLELVQDRRQNGLVSDLDVRQAESNLASTEADIPSLQSGLVQTINRLGVLLGQPPAHLHEELAKKTPIPVPPKDVAVGLPADLLRQRPDVRAAERNLASATAQIGVATADLYPRFSLSGTFALQGTQVKNLGNMDSRAWSFGPAMRWNIFDGVRNLYRVRAARAVTEQARARYEQTVLTALQDVENAMVAYKQEQIRREALGRSVMATQQAVDLVARLYQDGLTDFQNVLDTERTLFRQQDQLAYSEGQVTKNLIALYKALGGGWNPETRYPEPLPAIEPSGEETTSTVGRPTTQPARS